MRGSTHAAVSDMQRRLGLPPPPPPDPSGGGGIGPGILRQLLRLDAGGAWAAVANDEVVGAAIAGVRERLWYLANLHLMPGYQGRGIGRRLLHAALDYGSRVPGKMLHSSMDPQAMRTYQRAGFALEPTLQATGRVDGGSVPAIRTVRDGDANDLDLAAEIDRSQRGSAHGADLRLLVELGNRLLVIDDGPHRGYAVIDGSPRIVAATDVQAAQALLWAALAECSAEGISVHALRANQQWAIDVVVRAGLQLAPGGPLCTMGELGPMAPYLPHTGLL
jgi:hypothetical protein